MKIIMLILFAMLAVNYVYADGLPHVSNTTASYSPTNAKCSDCHITGDENNSAIRKMWASSGHADLIAPAWNIQDFKRLNGCVQCHTTTGFIAYSSSRMTSAWGDASDKTKEVLACNGCHTSIASGALRSPLTIRPYVNDSYRNQDVGPSNLCAGCHSGTMSGRSIKVLANFDTNFVGSHFLAASGILFKSIGYEFDGADYRNKVHFKHDRIGNNNYAVYGYNTGSKGPCIGCHMSSSAKHLFSPVTKDASEEITTLASVICAGCHTAPADLDAARMNNRKMRFNTSLLVLQKVLENKGIFYNANMGPYFFTNSSFSSPYTTWGSSDKMGAAFNLHLLLHEPGAYAHNMVYAKRLIYDSIDFLDDAALNNSVRATINVLATLDATQKATAIGYLTNSNVRP